MKRLLFLLALAALPAFPAFAASPAKPAGTLIDFRIEIQKSVTNDLGRASAYAEMTDADPVAVAQKIKAAIAEGLAIAKAQPEITVKSGNTHTWPAYTKGSRTIEGWRMRSEILLESRDAGALSMAVGKLQAILAVGNITFSPAPETRRKAEGEATLEAIAAFRTQAGRIAGALKKPYRIRQMSVNGSGHFPQPHALARSAALMNTEAAPMPIEAGESNITVNVSGKIELID